MYICSVDYDQQRRYSRYITVKRFVFRVVAKNEPLLFFYTTMQKKSFILHLDSLDVFDDLNNQEAGELIKTIIKYQRLKHNGMSFDLSEIDNTLIRVAFKPFKAQFDRDYEKYLSIVERNKLNGKSGGRPQKIEEANASPEKQTKAKKANAFKETQNNPVGFSETQNNPVGFSETQNNPVGKSGFLKNPKKPDNDNDNIKDNDNKKENNIILTDNKQNNIIEKKEIKNISKYNSTDNNDIFFISKKEEEKEKDWRKDFNVYLSELREEVDKILCDAEWMEKQKEFNPPELNIIKTIECAIENFWGTTEGWENKKKSKTKKINWKTTLAKALKIQTNRVFYPKNLAGGARGFAKKETMQEQTQRVAFKIMQDIQDGKDDSIFGMMFNKKEKE